jgi:hypothetical protein
VVRLVVAALALAVLLPLGWKIVDWVYGWEAPLTQETVDRSTPALMLALDDLSEYHAATGTFQVVVDLEHDTRYVPSVIHGDRTRFLATGSVDAYVDFGGLGKRAVETSPDGERVTISLPAPRLDEATVDPDESRVLDRDRGVLNRIGGMFGDGETDDGELYAVAEDKLEDAAVASDLRERAETNTRAMLTTLVRSLGFEQVTVEFDHTA